MTVPTYAPVAIVGSGPAGLSLAIELGHRGVRCVILERSPRADHAPRARTTHCRTREHLRRWSIADKLAAASPFVSERRLWFRVVGQFGDREVKLMFRSRCQNEVARATRPARVHETAPPDNAADDRSVGADNLTCGSGDRSRFHALQAGIGGDEALMILGNEMSRTLALLSSTSKQG